MASMEDIQLGFELYNKAEDLWLNAICTSNSFGPGIDYDGIRKHLMEEYYMPAASYGCPLAMLKCANYFKSSKPFLAATYMKNYIKAMRK